MVPKTSQSRACTRGEFSEAVGASKEEDQVDSEGRFCLILGGMHGERPDGMKSILPHVREIGSIVGKDWGPVLLLISWKVDGTGEMVLGVSLSRRCKGLPHYMLLGGHRVSLYNWNSNEIHATRSQTQ